MKKLIKLEEIKPEERTFKMSLADGSSSPFILVKDVGEWVLQGDSKQRFCESELNQILNKIQELNKADKVYKEIKVKPKKINSKKSKKKKN